MNADTTPQRLPELPRQPERQRLANLLGKSPPARCWLQQAKPTLDAIPNSKTVRTKRGAQSST